MKPDVLKQIEELTEEREKLMKEKREEIETHNSVVLNEMGLSQEQIENLKQNPMELNRLINENQIKINQNQVLLQLLTENNNQKQSQIMCEVNGKSQPLSDEQIVDILKKQDSTIQKLKEDNKNAHDDVRGDLRFIKNNLFDPKEGVWAEVKQNSNFRKETVKWRNALGLGFFSLIAKHVYDFFKSLS